MNSIDNYIDNIWVHNTQDTICMEVPFKSYPGITPEIIIPLEGSLEFFYQGRLVQTEKGLLFSFLHDVIINNLKSSPRFVVISFRSKAIASLLPFISIKPTELIKNPIVPLDIIFGPDFRKFQNKLQAIGDKNVIMDEVKLYMATFFNSNNTGFVTELVNEFGGDTNIKNILKHTKYSYSTIERKFKAETGLTPKRYLMLKRFKAALAKIVETENTNWMDYVVQFDYHDQSHFSREMKMFANLNPTDLLKQNNLLKVRPNIEFVTNFYNEK